MGGLFAKLRAGSISKFDLDLEREVDQSQLTEECRETFKAMLQCYDHADKAIAALNAYSDLKGAMKVVMDTARVDEHKAALEGCMESIAQIQGFYQVAVEINTEVPKLVEFIKSENLKDQEALCQVFSRLLAKMLEWDSLKVQRPSILNDFSFYRRNFAKMVEYDIPFPVLEQEANVISMFLAQPCPFTMGVAKKVKDSRDEEARLVFSNLANALCRAVTDGNQFRSPDTLDFACSAMTCAVVIFDHASDAGVFGSKDTKLKAIVDALGGYDDRGEMLLYFIKYNVKHFNHLCPGRLASQFPGQ